MSAKAQPNSCRYGTYPNGCLPEWEVADEPWQFLTPYKGTTEDGTGPAFLTPQDTDFGKSLIRFADEAFLTPTAEVVIPTGLTRAAP